MSSSTCAVIMAAARKAQKMKKKSATQLAEEAELEADRKAKCLLFEKEQRTEIDYDLLTPPAKPVMKELIKGGAAIINGDYVMVEPDLSPNKLSHGGNGYVVNFDGSGPNRTFTVKYDRCSISGSRRWWSTMDATTSCAPRSFILVSPQTTTPLPMALRESSRVTNELVLVILMFSVPYGSVNPVLT